ncbi:MAG: efflux RND transporter periplasmic adaptor subunit [Acidobacteriota bacterium]
MTRHSRSGYRWALALRARSSWVPVVAIVAALTASCGGSSQAPPAAAAGGGAPQGLPVEVVTLADKPIERAAEFIGTIKSRKSTTIQPQVEGILTGILVKSGDRVTAGTALFTIDATSQQAAVASLESMRAAREADAAYARQQAQRAKTLFDVGAMSQQELEQAQAQQKTADAQVQASDAQIRQQQTQLGYYRVIAPTAGVVGDIPVRQGDRVTPATVLTNVDEAGNFEIYMGIPVQQAASLKVGLPVRVLGDDGVPIATEKVSFIAPSVDDTTQTILVKTPLQPSGGRFRTDQFVRVQIVFETTPGVTIPVVSVTRINGQYFAFVVEKGAQGTVAKQRAVTIGQTVGNEYVATSGLKAGDQLIVSGVQKIGDGAPVTPMPARGAAMTGAAPGAGRAGGA